MSETLQFVVRSILIGVGATMVMDAWGLFLRRGLGIATLDYRLVGRWIGHFRHGRFVHAGIGKAAPVSGEAALGWAAHYGIGIAFAAALLAIAGPDWARAPTPLPALAFGILSVAAPFFVMQPGMGAGIAASKTPSPGSARLRSLATHAVFGLGLYLSAGLLAVLLPG